METPQFTFHGRVSSTFAKQDITAACVDFLDKTATARATLTVHVGAPVIEKKKKKKTYNSGQFAPTSWACTKCSQKSIPTTGVEPMTSECPEQHFLLF